MARRLGPLILLMASCAGAQSRSEALRLYEAGEFDRSVHHWTLAIHDRQDDAEAYYFRACARLHLIERGGAATEEALKQVFKDLDRAIELSPDDYRAYYARGMAHACLARYKEAVRDLLICVQARDRDLKPKAHRRIGQIYDEKFEHMEEAALRHYESYLQMGGDDPVVARRVEELKKPARPEGKAEAMFEMAEELYRSGKVEAAKAVLEELLKKHPESSAARERAPQLLMEMMRQK